MTNAVGTPRSLAQITFALVGFLFLLELTSGILQGYYIPLISDLVGHLDITDADFNWFEAAQLLLSALAVPILAKLGDMFGHKRMLLVSTALTAAASWWLVIAGDFTTFLIAWALQGFYSVWLPLEVALIFDRGRRSKTGVSQTRRAAGLLVIALEVGAIAGALGGGALFAGVFAGSVPLTLAVPAAVVTLVFFAILFGVPESERTAGRSLDVVGFVLLSFALLLTTSSLTFLRINGPGTWWVWVVMAAGLLAFLPFGRWVLGKDDPAIDLRALASPTMWPVQVTAGLFGISVLGAQIPLSTFAGTDPEIAGYGLGLSSGMRSIVIGIYLLSLIAGAALFAIFSRRLSPRIALIVATALVTVGYFALIPFHDDLAQVLTCICIAGAGSGALVAALPAAAAAAAPLGQTGIATGLTNTTKTVGGAFASATFGIALATGVTAGVGTAASLSGYYTVWIVCGASALIATVLLFFVPKLAFADPVDVE
ncbi:MFS transporter [Pseudolysinimonas yzui]|uniref:MFS transporter n=1 Tax=Pseudolysinimonas yzui TaxID=2708254 RepID=A0A8J3LYI6_9MICO|nr:MFS transporter [Pseudolysinimonas yzui]GHF06838.1 MFS transporter [Pseudolysinimonas yzui]